MGKFIQIDVDLGPMETDLQKFALRIQGEMLAPKMGAGALEEVKRSYQAETDPDGVPWEPRTPKYQAYKDRVRPGKQKGHFDEPLFNSLAFRVEGTAADIGSIGGPEYAAAQNFGTSFMQRSEFAGVSSAFVDNMVEDIFVYMTEGEFGGTLA